MSVFGSSGPLGVLLFAQFVLFGMAVQVGQTWLWQLACWLAVLANGWGWLRAMRYRRIIRDTPTSRIVSAAQGYVELTGKAVAHEGQEIQSPLTFLPCLWYRYVAEERRDNDWRQVDQGESAALFALDDGSGVCVIDPRGARVESLHKEFRQLDDYRQTEWLLLKNDSLYVIGEYHSERGADRQLDAQTDEGALLAEWKRDQAGLLERFDLDHNGEISQQEWMLARLAARREVARQHAEIRQLPASHGLGKPEDGRPYLISNKSQQKLSGAFTLWAGFYLLATLLALIFSLWWLRR